MLFNITYTSLNFLFFVLATMLVYFLFPAKKYKWTVLLAASMFFYAVAGYKYAFFILFTTLSTYLIALWISRVSASVFWSRFESGLKLMVSESLEVSTVFVFAFSMPMSL